MKECGENSGQLAFQDITRPGEQTDTQESLYFGVQGNNKMGTYYLLVQWDTTINGVLSTAVAFNK